MKKNRFILVFFVFLMSCCFQIRGHTQVQGGTQAQFQVGSLFVEFQTANSFSEGYASISVKRANELRSKFGYISKEGKKAIDFRFDEVKDFSEGLAAVKIGVHWGYIDMSGIYVIPSQFDEVYSFSGESACVGIGPAKSRKYGYIDKRGKYIINPQFEEPDRFANKFLVVKRRSKVKSKTVVKYGYRYLGSNKEKFDRNEEKDFPFVYDEAYLFTEYGLARVKQGTTYVHIRSDEGGLASGSGTPEWDSGESGTQVSRYAEASDFSEGFAFVKYDKLSSASDTPEFSDDSEKKVINFDQYTYINTEGNPVGEFQFDFADDFSNGLARIGKKEEGSSTFKYGYINTEGEVVIIPQFDFADDFSASGLARVNIGGVQQEAHKTVKGGRYGYINGEGEIVINPKFAVAKNFSEGLAYVMTADTTLKRGYISADYSEEFAIELDLSLVYAFSTEGANSDEDLALISLDRDGRQKYGYIDRLGKVVISPMFDLASNFQFDLACVGTGNGRNLRYGYIDKTGNYVIEPSFNDAGDFFQVLQDVNAGRLDNFPPLARVEIDGKVSYINKKGNIINPDDTQSLGKRR